MYQEISQLLMYGDIDENEILYQLGQLFARFEKGGYDKMELVRDINTQVKRILKVATDYGFDDNLWHNYLTFYLMMNENPFSMTCEKVGASEGSVNGLVQQDFALFKKLFDYDFSRIEGALEIIVFQGENLRQLSMLLHQLRVILPSRLTSIETILLMLVS